MSITSITLDFAGQADVEPRLCRLVCTDDAETIMTENYLQPLQQTGYQFKPTDQIHIDSPDGFGIFRPVFAGENITLEPMTVQNNDDPPSYVNNLIMYVNEMGVIGDSGIDKSSVPVVTGATVVGDLPTFNNITGGIADSGVALTALQTKASIKANVGTYAGGAASFSFTATGVTTSSVISVDFKTQANPAGILIVSPGTNVINVTATVDPGASTLNWIAFAAAQ